jgi:hypothetical protein
MNNETGVSANRKREWGEQESDRALKKTEQLSCQRRLLQTSFRVSKSVGSRDLSRDTKKFILPTRSTSDEKGLQMLSPPHFVGY